MSLFADLAVVHPIIQAPMAGVTTPELAAAVCKAGALGSLGLGAASPERARDEIRALRSATDAAFNVNFFCHGPPTTERAARRAWIAHLAPHFARYEADLPSDLTDIYAPIDDNPAMRQVILDEQPPVVSFHFGVPGHGLIEAIHDYGGRVLICVTTRSEAEAAAAAGADALIAQGAEAGGHRGNFDADHDAEVPLADLLADLLATQSTPVIAAGGLMDGADIHRVRAAGAIAAQLGTAFVAASESAAAPAYRAALAAGGATAITRAISGRPARGLVGVFQREIAPGAPVVPDYPLTYDAAKQLHAAARTQDDHRYAPNWAGEGVARVRAMPAGDLVAILVRELETAAEAGAPT